MPMSPYVERLRRKVGHDLVLMPAVAVLVRDGGGRLLLVRQADDGRWGLVGGSVEIGESPAEAAVREVREETGLEIRLGAIVAAVGGPSYEVEYPGGDRVAYVAVIMEAEERGGHPTPDGDEVVEIGWFATAELADLELNDFARAALAQISYM